MAADPGRQRGVHGRLHDGRAHAVERLSLKARVNLKDLAAAAAQGRGRRLPMLDAVRERVAEAVEAGLGEKDWPIMADLPPGPGAGGA